MEKTDLTPSLARVTRGNLCAGCGGCAAISGGAISMERSEKGYLRPVQTGSVSAAVDARIEAICPGLGQSVDVAGRETHPLWGPYVSMYTGYATDNDLRFSASSGGGLSGIILHLMDTGAVDGAVEIKADPSNPVGNVTVIARDADTVRHAVGSRYAPSAPLAEIEPLLAGSERFAFVGKPCDIAALRALSGHDPRVDKVFPVMMSFFCGGVPSQKGAEGILEALGTSLPEVSEFRFRGFGWPGRATATLKSDGTTRDMSYHESWGLILSKHVQHRCKVCADGTGKAADIVCADAWHADENGYPLFEEKDGISLIVGRTETGASIIAQAREAGAIATEDFDVKELKVIQTGQFWRRRVVLSRLVALRMFGRPIPNYKGLTLLACARMSTVKESGKNFLGMVRRVIQGRV
jgi:coenzyme F420 hydrogenase subunit beta